MEQERLEQEERERRYREREEQIEEHRHGRGQGQGAVSHEMRDGHTQDDCACATSGWVGAWMFVPAEDGAGQGPLGRGWQEPVPSPSPVSLLQAEAAEHGGRGGPAAPEGAVHLRKCRGRHGAGVGAGAAAWHHPQRRAFPSRAPRAARGWGVMPRLFPGGAARGG